jgi:hypothetical protein
MHTCTTWLSAQQQSSTEEHMIMQPAVGDVCVQGWFTLWKLSPILPVQRYATTATLTLQVVNNQLAIEPFNRKGLTYEAVGREATVVPARKIQWLALLSVLDMLPFKWPCTIHCTCCITACVARLLSWTACMLRKPRDCSVMG